MASIVETLDTSISTHLRAARSETAAAAFVPQTAEWGSRPSGTAHQGDWLDQIGELLLELDPHIATAGAASKALTHA
jgi:hypothetical protein